MSNIIEMPNDVQEILPYLGFKKCPVFSYIGINKYKITLLDADTPEINDVGAGWKGYNVYHFDVNMNGGDFAFKRIEDALKRINDLVLAEIEFQLEYSTKELFKSYVFFNQNFIFNPFLLHHPKYLENTPTQIDTAENVENNINQTPLTNNESNKLNNAWIKYNDRLINLYNVVEIEAIPSVWLGDNGMGFTEPKLKFLKEEGAEFELKYVELKDLVNLLLNHNCTVVDVTPDKNKGKENV